MSLCAPHPKSNFLFQAIFCLAAAAWAAPEAEAEADPALLYGAYGYAGLGAYGYAGLGAYAGYPYAYGAYAGLPYAHAIAAPAVAALNSRHSGKVLAQLHHKISEFVVLFNILEI